MHFRGYIPNDMVVTITSIRASPSKSPGTTLVMRDFWNLQRNRGLAGLSNGSSSWASKISTDVPFSKKLHFTLLKMIHPIYTSISRT